MKKKSPPKKKGRPTDYDPKFCKIATQLCLLGATHESLAASFEVTISTITEWKRKYPAFSAAIKDGRENADNAVAASLYGRALGYTHKSKKIQLHRDGTWKEREFIEHYPPDPTSAIFWLKNRRPDLWREKLDIEQKIIKVRVPGEHEEEG